MAASPYHDALAAMPPHRFALIDGAHFEGLPKQLAELELKGQPLYLEGPDRDAVESGPFLVEVATPTKMTAVLSLVRSKPAVVFWSWIGGQPSLHRHLRSLTMAEIPLSGDAEPVLFRIADPRVLSLVLPVLTLEQLARFTGAAAQVIFARDDGAPVTLAPAGVEASRGFLRLSREQYGVVERGFEAALISRAVAEFAPRIATAPPEQAAAQVRHAFARARHYGFEEVEDVWQFIAWDVTFGMEFERQPAFTGFYGELTATDHTTAQRMTFIRYEIDALYKTARTA